MKKKIREKILAVYQRLFDYYGPQRWWPADTPFEVIVGAVLTQNTAWGNVEKAIRNIKDAGLFSPHSLYRLKNEEIARYIRPSGYYNIKAKRLKSLLTFLVERYSGNLQTMFKGNLWSLREELLKINGIGPETADSILLYAGNMPVFVVDAYTKRVFSRHGFLLPQASYDDYQRFFMGSLSNDAGLFNEYHALIVRVGKEYCKKTKPICEQCPLKGLF